jgi:hypothetical protein
MFSPRAAIACQTSSFRRHLQTRRRSLDTKMVTHGSPLPAARNSTVQEGVDATVRLFAEAVPDSGATFNGGARRRPDPMRPILEAGRALGGPEQLTAAYSAADAAPANGRARRHASGAAHLRGPPGRLTDQAAHRVRGAPQASGRRTRQTESFGPSPPLPMVAPWPPPESRRESGLPRWLPRSFLAAVETENALRAAAEQRALEPRPRSARRVRARVARGSTTALRRTAADLRRPTSSS